MLLTRAITGKQTLPEHKTDKHQKLHGHYSNAFLNLPLRNKLAICFSLLLIIASTAFWLIFQNELKRSLSDHLNILGSSLSGQAASSLREFVLVNDLLALNVALTQLARDDNILHAIVYDVDGNQLASAGTQPTAQDAGDNYYQTNITVQDSIAGSVQLALNNDAIASYQTRLRTLFLVILIVSLVLTVTSAYALAGRISSSINGLTRRIEEKLLDHDADEGISSADEIQRMEHAAETLLGQFEHMQEQLQETGLWQHEDDEDTDGEPVRQAASILIIKVVNINTAIELLHPTTLGKLLREYIFYLNQSVRLHGGDIQRLNGDSILICFNSIKCKDRHSINALHCAGLFQTLMGKVNARHKEKGQQMLEFRMALHSGDVFLAPNISTINDEAVLGKTIDIAYYLSKQAEPNQLIISESACSQAKAFDSFDAAGQREISMPADNMSFMAYILDHSFVKGMDTLHKQCAQILGEPSQYQNNKVG